MTTEILYSEIDNKILDRIKVNLNLSDIVFIEVSEADYFNLFKEEAHTQGIVIIGEQTSNPFQLAQKVHTLDKNISILIVTSPQNFERFKQGLKFTPFIGNTVKCIADQSEANLASTIEELINKTKQRRNYVKLKASARTFLKDKPDLEQIRTDFLNKYLEFAPIGTIILSAEKIAAVNEYAANIFSQPESTIINKSLFKYFPDKEVEALRTFLDKKLSIQVFHRFEGRDMQYLELRVAELPSRYKLLILNDITDKINANLKIEDQLLELKKINSDLDNFIYTASHDLKAPITNVEGLMNALTRAFSEETAAKEQVKKIVGMIFQSIDRFKTTLGDLSEIAKLEKAFEGDQQELNIASVVEDVKISISEFISENNATISTNFTSKTIFFSKKNLKSIIYNLISNAIKYKSPQRPPKIEIACEEDDVHHILIVRDNGLGIPGAKIQTIFEMFKRLHNHVEGSGIGLYIVKRIVENADGKISVESEEGEGTVFRIFLKKPTSSTFG